MNNDNNPSMNQQNYSHAEGQQNNKAPKGDGPGHPSSENNSHQLSDMMDDGEQSGRAKGQNEGSNRQQDERKP